MENSNKVITVSPDDVKTINQNPKKSKKVGRVIKSTTSFILAAISLALAIFMYFFVTEIANTDFGLAVVIVVIIAGIFLLGAIIFAIIANLMSFALLMTDKKSISSLIAYLLNLLGMLANIGAGVWFLYLLSVR